MGSLTDVSVRDSRRTEPAPKWFEPNHPTEALASTKPKRVLPEHTEGGILENTNHLTKKTKKQDIILKY